MFRPRAPSLFAFASLLASVGCRNGDKPVAKNAALLAEPSAPSWTPARVADLYFSTSVEGHLEPCGCTKRPLGGLPRLATAIAKGEAEHGLVDAGNLLFPKDVTPVRRDQYLLAARTIARAYRMLGAVALNLGPNDLGGGLEFLRGLRAEGAVPWLSANTAPSDDAGPTVARSFVRTIGGIAFGITGVRARDATGGSRAEIADWPEPLANEVRALREARAEIIIVLADVGDLAARQIARSIEGVDVVIRSPGTPIERDPASPARVGQALVVESGSQGQRIGRLHFQLDREAPVRPLVVDDGGAAFLAETKRIVKKIAAYEVDVDAWSSDPAKAEAVRAKRAQIDELRERLRSTAAKGTSPNVPHVRVDLVELGPETPNDAKFEAMLAAYYKELEKLNRGRGDLELCKPKDAKAARYVGTSACKKCHEDAYVFWTKTKHARAWGTLEERGKHFDLTCVGCHTVGYEQAGGFCRLDDVAPYENVGCENCHGPGSVHVDDEEPSSIFAEIDRYTCAKSCHVPEHSEGFAYERYLREITGVGHERSEK